MPSVNGISNWGIISRMMDAESYQRGESLYWHTAIIQNGNSTDSVRNLDKMYANFLSDFSTAGFNPELCPIPAIGNEKGFGLLSGSHRLGYLLSKNENTFLPITVSVRDDDSLWTSADKGCDDSGFRQLARLGIPSERIDAMRKRYAEFVKKLRKHIYVFISLPVFFDNSEAITAAVNSVGKCFEIRAAQNNLPFEKRLDLKDGVPEAIYKHDSLAVLSVEISYQALYYKDHKLRSFVSDEITNKLNAALGDNWGYVGATITESVNLEVTLFDMAANEGQLTRAYSLESVIE